MKKPCSTPIYAFFFGGWLLLVASVSAAPLSPLTESDPQALPTAQRDHLPQRTVLSSSWDEPFIALEETVSPEKSPNEDFWLNSGGLAIFVGETLFTLQGDVGERSVWRREYRRSNPIDTIDGRRPQNVFRLLSKQGLANPDQIAFFTIADFSLSDSPQRNESNGILLMSNVQDADNLYYSGIRVDGMAVIKKKEHGVYHTLAIAPLPDFPGTYDRSTHPALLPDNRRLGIRATTQVSGTDVVIHLFLERSGQWEEVLSATDSPAAYGRDPFYSGNVGIRTDFMDVVFSRYVATEKPL
jgi:hypothetical protein